MDAHLLSWLSMSLRWFHLVTGAAWIGASFYFNWLNNNVRPPESADANPGVKGEVWAIHGGAFYRASKFGGAPAALPATLHWFMYEAYFTWITGFLLLITTYWLEAKAMMIDTAVRDLSSGAAVGVAAGALVLGWFVYDGLCRSPLAKQPRVFAALGLVLLVAASFGLFSVMAARAAAMHLGAMIGTIMAANVFFVIIPGQRALVDAMVGNKPLPLEKGAAGALRSLHNNYLTLPALFVMVSNHYPNVWGHALGWLVVPVVCVLGVCIRHGYNLRGQGAPRPFVISWIGAAGLLIVAVATYKAPVSRTASGEAAVTLTQAQMIIAARCMPCHAAEPTQAGFVEPPKGLSLQDPAVIVANREKIGAQVESRAMPLGNLTGMTDEERALLLGWARGE
ncbi:membrane protein [Deltaproteobacteria bacterium]|nr:membrane protein [Deltaproteobacteria bacterium]